MQEIVYEFCTELSRIHWKLIFLQKFPPVFGVYRLYTKQYISLLSVPFQHNGSLPNTVEPLLKATLKYGHLANWISPNFR